MNLHTEELIQEAQRTDNQLAITIINRLESQDLTTMALQTIADSITTCAQEQCIKNCNPACDYLADGIIADTVQTALKTLLDEIDAPLHRINICKPFDTCHQSVNLLEKLLADYSAIDLLIDDINRDTLNAITFHTGCAPDIFLDSHHLDEQKIDTCLSSEWLANWLKEYYA